jgi:hypothetical protein
LEQLKLTSDKEPYSRIVDSVVVGTANVKAAYIERILGIIVELFNKSKNKINDLIEEGNIPSWTQKEETPMISEVRNNPKPRTSRIQSLTTMSSNQLKQIYRKRKAQMEFRNTKRTPSMASSNLYHQLELFSKFGGPGSQGSQITLSQSGDQQLECDNH